MSASVMKSMKKGSHRTGKYIPRARSASDSVASLRWRESLGMLTAHLLSAVLSGLWLAYGERAVFRVLRALPAGLFRPLRLLLTALPVPQDRTRLPAVRRRDERAPRQLHLAYFIISRGPPQAVAVV
ncbi:hypothetical protein [Streptomyces sp. NPDC056401]|uniref:hypothetical protein n=1 Tax=Streptomyces sp. NPDC056401 TaxID=3345809 RepID=UPI0035DB41B1